jgi:serine/threonine protein kinase
MDSPTDNLTGQADPRRSVDQAEDAKTVSGRVSQPLETTQEFADKRSMILAYLRQVLGRSSNPQALGELQDYTVFRLIGAGGMGAVLAAEDNRLRRLVAVKVMLPEDAANREARDRFLREARAIAAVEHPRIIPIHQVGEWNNIPYLVMPLLKGRTLAARMGDLPRLSTAQVLRIMCQAAEGLAAAHARGLVHRDIKPENIWLEDTDEPPSVRILDFGLAREIHDNGMTMPGSLLGTPSYMAPEQAAGDLVDGRADIFSLGCVFYELLAHRRPFTGNSAISILNAIATQTPPRPIDLNHSIPVSASDVCMSMLEKSPDSRPPTMASVALKLRQCEESTGDNRLQPTPATPKQPLAPENRRRRAIPIVIAGLIIFAVGVGCRWWWQIYFAEDETSLIRASASSRDSEGVVAAPEANTAARLRVADIEVLRYANTADGDIPQGRLGRGTFVAELGDRVQAVASLSRPAYGYLIAVRPDGVWDICDPVDDHSVPIQRPELRYPRDNAEESYGLREGSGLWAFVVIASDRPLPAYRDWLTDRRRLTEQWRPPTKVPRGIVWWNDGDQVTAMSAATNDRLVLRGKGETLDGPAASIAKLVGSIRETGQGYAVGAVGFEVVP